MKKDTMKLSGKICTSPRKSRLYVDGKEIALKSISVHQDMDNIAVATIEVIVDELEIVDIRISGDKRKLPKRTSKQEDPVKKGIKVNQTKYNHIWDKAVDTGDC